MTYIPEISPSLEAHWAKHGNAEGGHSPLIAHTPRADGFDASQDGTGRGTPLVFHENRSASVTEQEGTAALRAGASHSYQFVTAFDWQAGHGKDESFKGKSRQYIVRKGDYTGSLQENKRDAVQYGAAVRRLTPTECERLQGFPDGWTDGADGPRYRALGNAVTVSVIQYLGERVIAIQNGQGEML